MKLLILALALFSTTAMAADFTITVKPAATPTVKDTYVYSNNQKIGVFTSVGSYPAVKTDSGIIYYNSLTRGDEYNASLGISGTSEIFTNRYFDEACSKPILSSTEASTRPIGGSLLNIINGFTKFTFMPGVSYESIPFYQVTRSGGVKVCVIASSTFTGPAWPPESFNVIDVSIPTNNISIRFE